MHRSHALEFGGHIDVAAPARPCGGGSHMYSCAYSAYFVFGVFTTSEGGLGMMNGFAALHQEQVSALVVFWVQLTGPWVVMAAQNAEVCVVGDVVGAGVVGDEVVGAAVGAVAFVGAGEGACVGASVGTVLGSGGVKVPGHHTPPHFALHLFSLVLQSPSACFVHPPHPLVPHSSPQ